jgi:glycosyltransferase involved in cell wall biosynthesis
MSLRIGIDAREMLPDVRTGIGRYLRNFLEASIPTHPGTQFVLFGNQNTEFGEVEANVEIARERETRTAVWDQRILPRLASDHNVDVLFSPFDKGPVSAPCPVVITIHDLTPLLEPGASGVRRSLYKSAYKWSRKLYARRASTVITDSAHSKDDIVSFFRIKADKVHPIPIGLPGSYRPASQDVVASTVARYGLAKPFVLYVGNFKPHKNLDALISAYQLLPAGWQESVDLALCGGKDAHRGELEERVRQHGLSDRVHFLGFVPDEDMPGLYGGALMLSFPSLYEGFGLPPLEAMACGAPVVCSNATSLPEVVGDAGLLVDAHHPEEIQAAMLKLLEDDSLRSDLIERGQARAGQYSPDATAEQVYHVLAQAVKGNRKE